MDKKQKKISWLIKNFSAMKTLMIMRINEKRLFRNILVIVPNAIKQQVVPPQKESSSNRFVNDLVTSLRKSHSSDDFDGTEVIHVKPKIIEEAHFTTNITSAKLL